MQGTPSRRYQQLQPEHRVTLASLVQQSVDILAIAWMLGRSPSTISRELRRNAQPAGYASTPARPCAQLRRVRARLPGKLHCDGIVFDLIRHFLAQHRSPEQIALTLVAIYPKGHEYRVSHQTYNNSIYVQPVGELIATLPHVHNKSVPRSKGQDQRGQIPDMVSIHVRPPEIGDRQFPGHWEGDLLKRGCQRQCGGHIGRAHQSTAHAYQTARIQARQRGQCDAGLQRRAAGHCSAHAPEHDYDQGREMAMHKQLSRRT